MSSDSRNRDHIWVFLSCGTCRTGREIQRSDRCAKRPAKILKRKEIYCKIEERTPLS